MVRVMPTRVNPKTRGEFHLMAAIVLTKIGIHAMEVTKLHIEDEYVG